MAAGKILLVEDDADLRFAYELIIRQAGYDLAVATNGQEALDLLDAHDPSLVLLDIFMPVMDGREFLRHLDDRQRLNRSIVVCTNTSEEAVIEAVKQLGVSEVILKSKLDPAGLLGMISSYFDRQPM